MNMKKEKRDNYPVYFKGGKLTRREAKIAETSIVFGIIGMVIVFFTPVAENKLIAYSIIIVFVIIGLYCGNKIFKKE